jgi:hypothetical protein
VVVVLEDEVAYSLDGNGALVTRSTPLLAPHNVVDVEDLFFDPSDVGFGIERHAIDPEELLFGTEDAVFGTARQLVGIARPLFGVARPLFGIARQLLGIARPLLRTARPLFGTA